MQVQAFTSYPGQVSSPVSFIKSTFHFGCSGGKSNGTGLSTGNVLEKRNTSRGIPLFLFLLERPEISVPFVATSLFVHRARLKLEPKNAKIYPLN